MARTPTTSRILTETPSDLFGVVIVTKDGKVYTAGDVDYEFSIQSVSKPFTAALVMAQQSPEVAQGEDRRRAHRPAVQLQASAVEIYKARSVNPLVNAGAIAARAWCQASSEADRWNKVSQNLSDFAGRPLTVLEKVYDSESRRRRQSRHREPAVQLGSSLQRSGGSAAGLHARVLGRRQRQGPGDDGRDAGERRRQPGDGQAGDACRGTCRNCWR